MYEVKMLTIVIFTILFYVMSLTHTENNTWFDKALDIPFPSDILRFITKYYI